MVLGKGTKINDNHLLQRRAKRKTITQSMILNLINVAKTKEEPENRNKINWNKIFGM